MEDIQRVVVAGVLIRDRKALILKRSSDESSYPNMWELSGGKVDFGEDPNTAVEREFLEETGLKVDVLGPFKVTHYTVERADSKSHIVQIFYCVRSAFGFPIKLTSGHVDFAWISPEELYKHDIFGDAVEALRIAFGGS